MKIVCPRCLGENYTANTRTGSHCTYCNFFFSPKDIEIKLEWRKDIERLKEVEVGSWSNSFVDDDFWGNY